MILVAGDCINLLCSCSSKSDSCSVKPCLQLTRSSSGKNVSTSLFWLHVLIVSDTLLLFYSVCSVLHLILIRECYFSRVMFLVLFISLLPQLGLLSGFNLFHEKHYNWWIRCYALLRSYVKLTSLCTFIPSSTQRASRDLSSTWGLLA